MLAIAVGALMIGAVALAQQVAPASKSATTAPSSATTGAQSAVNAASGKAAGTPIIKSASAQTPADLSAQLIKDARDAGFKPTHVRGALMFCRTAIELGSNFPVRTCYNEQQVAVKIQEYQAQRDQLRGKRFLPAGMPVGCSSRACQ